VKNIFFILCCLIFFPYNYLHADNDVKNCTEQPQLTFDSCPQVKAFIEELLNKKPSVGYTRTQLLEHFSKVSFDPEPLSLMVKTGESKPWSSYIAQLLSPKKIVDGLAFYKKNQDILEKISAKYGVSAPIIVSTLGMETNYGAFSGRFKLLNTLSNLAFNYPKTIANYKERELFFKEQLHAFFILAHRNIIDISTTKGSYAGAVGIPQFMPKNILEYGVDDVGNTEKVDIINNVGHAAASVANYYKNKGAWEQNGMVMATKEGLCRTPQGKHYAPTQSIVDPGTEYEQKWLTCNNFASIRKYNINNKYAMAVYLLAEEIRKVVEMPAKM